MAKKNRTICIALKNDVEYFEEHEGSFFRQLVKDNGMIGTGKKAVQCAHAWLVEGSGAVLADWRNVKPQEFEWIGGPKPGTVLKGLTTTDEDPVERIKRQAKARIAPADATENGFPKPQPWVDPKETEAIDL